MSPRVRALSIVLVGFAVVALGAAAVEVLDVLGAPAAAEPVVAAVTDDSPTAAPSGRIRAQVLNGAGRAGLARQGTEHLRSAGFDVVYFGNAATFGHDTTVVIDRVGDESMANAVAAALGIPVQIRSEPDPTLFLEVTVILGEDWPPDTPRRADTSHPVTRLWRRLFDR